MKLGILLIEVEDYGADRRTTGRLVVLREEAARRVFTGSDGEEVIRMRAAHVDVRIFEAMGLAKQFEAHQ